MGPLRISLFLIVLPIFGETQFYPNSQNRRAISQSRSINGNANNLGVNFRTSNQPSSEASNAVDAISRGLFKLALNLDGAIGKLGDGGDNVVLSPICLQIALATVLLGSGGHTSQELERILGVGLISDISRTTEIFHQTLSQLTGQLSRPRERDAISEQDSPLTKFASGLFVQDDLSLQDQFQAATKKFYGSEVLKVNFANGGEAAKRFINNWVEDKTMSKIKDLLKEPPSADTVLMILSALYFKGKWMTPFMKVPRKPFNIAPNKTIYIDMLDKTDDYPYYFDDELKVEIVGIPYKGSEVFMYAILPYNNGEEDLRDLKKRLTAEKLEELINEMSVHTVRVTIPKMDLSSSQSLKRALQGLGLTLLFGHGADLSGFLSTQDTSHQESTRKQRTNRSRHKRSPQMIFPGPTNADISTLYHPRRTVYSGRTNRDLEKNPQPNRRITIPVAPNVYSQGVSEPTGEMIFPGPTENSLNAYRARSATKFPIPSLSTIRPNPDFSQSYQNGRKLPNQTFVYSYENQQESYYLVAGPSGSIWKHVGKPNHNQKPNDSSYQNHMTVPATSHQQGRPSRIPPTSFDQKLNRDGDIPNGAVDQPAHSIQPQPSPIDQQSSASSVSGEDILKGTPHRGIPGLYVEDIVHAVEMTIDEKGTEAAAATAVSIGFKSGGTPRMLFNRPFLFFIRHNPTKSLLFWASINKPTPYYEKP